MYSRYGLAPYGSGKRREVRRIQSASLLCSDSLAYLRRGEYSIRARSLDSVPPNAMRIDDDDQSGDPQSTLRPHHSQQRTTEARGRRLILGSPRLTTDAASAEGVSTLDGRGFSLGRKSNIPASSTNSKTTVQPWIIMVAVGALILLVVALLLRPSTAGSAEALANERLLNQYTKYLEARGVSNSSQISERRKDVVNRLQAVAWARAVDDRVALEKELNALLFLDDDKSSPLYQYSVTQLKQLGPRKRRSAVQ